MINYAEEIKRAVPARELFEHYGFEINRAGFCHSPFAANDKTPSLKIYECDRGWHDFSSGKGGDIIAFVQEYFRLSFPDACAKINSDFHLDLPIGKRLSLRELREAEQATRERKRKLESERAEHTGLIETYNILLDMYTKLDRIRIQYAPDRLSGDISDFYAQAIKDIPIIEDALTEAEMRLYTYEHNRPRDS